MKKDELLHHVGAMVEFIRDGSRYCGQLMGVISETRTDVHDVNVVVELPNTRLRLSLPSQDVTLVVSDTSAGGKRS